MDKCIIYGVKYIVYAVYVLMLNTRFCNSVF